MAPVMKGVVEIFQTITRLSNERGKGKGRKKSTNNTTRQESESFQTSCK
jgi:hypothetical protein